MYGTTPAKPLSVFAEIERRSAAQPQSAPAGQMQATAAPHTHYTEDVCPVCQQKMTVEEGADNFKFYFCQTHCIAQPVPLNKAQGF